MDGHETWVLVLALLPSPVSTDNLPQQQDEGLELQLQPCEYAKCYPSHWVTT